jgi:4-hydroxybenzoate polyprenyltransferase
MTNHLIVFFLGVFCGICIKMVIDALTDAVYDFYNEEPEHDK